MRKPRLLTRAACTLLAVFALGAATAAPAHADEKKQVFVKPGEMAAAQAANKKAAEARKLLKEGKHAEGVKMLDEAVGELERTTGPDSDFSRVNREAVVGVYKALKQPDKAEAVLKRAETARKSWTQPTSQPANANTASAMVKMTAGLEALKANNFAKAAELLEQALPDVAKSDASGKMYLMIAGVLASLYDYSQQFAKGEALRKDVIAKMEKLVGEDSPEVAEQYESLATHYTMRLDTPKAIAAQKKSVELTRKKQQGSVALGDRLLALGNFYIETGDYSSAQPVLSEAMLVIRGLSPLDPLRMVRIARMAVSLADAELKFKEGDQAADMTCKVAQASGKAEVLEEAENECIRAAIARNDIKAAGELAGARFLRIEKRHGTSGPFFAHAAHELALVRWVEGKKDEATTLAKRGAEAQEKHLVRLLNASGDTQKRAQISMLSAQGYDLLSMGGAGNGGGTAQTRLALETVLRRKGRSLDASADAARVVRLFQGGAEKTLASRQVEVRRQIAALGLRGGGGGGGGGLVDPVALLARLEAEDDDISNKLAAASPLYRAQARPVTIESVQATIPDDGALIEYVYYLPRDTTSARFAPKGISFAAFVLHKTGEPVAIDLGDALPIGTAVDELRKTQHGGRRAAQDAREPRRRLAERQARPRSRVRSAEEAPQVDRHSPHRLARRGSQPRSVRRAHRRQGPLPRPGLRHLLRDERPRPPSHRGGGLTHRRDQQARRHRQSVVRRRGLGHRQPGCSAQREQGDARRSR
jgi:tetratricopeptide (TPR) repeat protein